MVVDGRGNHHNGEGTMENVKVIVNFHPDREIFNYSQFSVTPLDTGNDYTLSGFYDGDMCEDIRRTIQNVTDGGNKTNVHIYLSRRDYNRWVDSCWACIEHYAP